MTLIHNQLLTARECTQIIYSGHGWVVLGNELGEVCAHREEEIGPRPHHLVLADVTVISGLTVMGVVGGPDAMEYNTGVLPDFERVDLQPLSVSWYSDGIIKSLHMHLAYVPCSNYWLMHPDIQCTTQAYPPLGDQKGQA